MSPLSRNFYPNSLQASSTYLWVFGHQTFCLGYWLFLQRAGAVLYQASVDAVDPVSVRYSFFYSLYGD